MSKAPVIPFPQGSQGSKTRHIEYIIEQYHKAHPDEDVAEAVPDLIAEWAYKKGLWNRPPADPVTLLQRDISRYLRNSYFEDPQGREVRKNHAIFIWVQTPDGLKKRSVWKELFHAPPEHMRMALQLRRRAAARDVMQLDLDFKSYNENNVFGATIPKMDYDMNKDVEEVSLPTTYPEPDEDDDI